MAPVRKNIMLARAVCRVLTVFYALLYFIVGVYGGGPKGDHAASTRKHITSVLLGSVVSGYPKAGMTNLHVSGGGRIPVVKVSKHPIATAGRTSG